jgi:hypothetical protein
MKIDAAAAILSERVHALTTSTQFPGDEVASSGKSLEPDARLYRKQGYFVRSPRRVLDRLRAAAIEFVSIALLVAGFIMAALFALDLSDRLQW